MASFAGTWRVVSSPDFDRDYLSMEMEPYLVLHQSGGRVEGRYQAGLQTGELDGRLEGGNFVFFSFAGMDEMDEVDGAATATLNGDRPAFDPGYHRGDAYAFECERVR